jgi:hypothetical protein
MAKVHEQVLVLKISRLIKDRDTETDSPIDLEFINNAEAVLQELVGNNYVVEVVADL